MSVLYARLCMRSLLSSSKRLRIGQSPPSTGTSYLRFPTLPPLNGTNLLTRCSWHRLTSLSKKIRYFLRTRSTLVVKLAGSISKVYQFNENLKAHGSMISRNRSFFPPGPIMSISRISSKIIAKMTTMTNYLRPSPKQICPS